MFVIHLMIKSDWSISSFFLVLRFNVCSHLEESDHHHHHRYEMTSPKQHTWTKCQRRTNVSSDPIDYSWPIQLIKVKQRFSFQVVSRTTNPKKRPLNEVIHSTSFNGMSIFMKDSFSLSLPFEHACFSLSLVRFSSYFCSNIYLGQPYIIFFSPSSLSTDILSK